MKSSLSTLCYIEKDGQYLMLHRTVKKNDVNKDKWIGVGGHFEADESPEECLLREVWEETGLTIESPILCGLYHWYKGAVHNVITLYKAEKFTGTLTSSEEGKVYWIPVEELKSKELATGMEYVLKIMESEQIGECYMHLEANGFVGDLY